MVLLDIRKKLTKRGETGSIILSIGEVLPIGIDQQVNALVSLQRDRFKAGANLGGIMKKALNGKPLNP